MEKKSEKIDKRGRLICSKIACVEDMSHNADITSARENWWKQVKTEKKPGKMGST